MQHRIAVNFTLFAAAIRSPTGCRHEIVDEQALTATLSYVSLDQLEEGE